MLWNGTMDHNSVFDNDNGRKGTAGNKKKEGSKKENEKSGKGGEC